VLQRFFNGSFELNSVSAGDGLYAVAQAERFIPASAAKASLGRSAEAAIFPRRLTRTIDAEIT
jgi:hypothetical protein